MESKVVQDYMAKLSERLMTEVKRCHPGTKGIALRMSDTGEVFIQGHDGHTAAIAADAIAYYLGAKPRAFAGQKAMISTGLFVRGALCTYDKKKGFVDISAQLAKWINAQDSYEFESPLGAQALWSGKARKYGVSEEAALASVRKQGSGYSLDPEYGFRWDSLGADAPIYTDSIPPFILTDIWKRMVAKAGELERERERKLAEALRETLSHIRFPSKATWGGTEDEYLIAVSKILTLQACAKSEVNIDPDVRERIDLTAEAFLNGKIWEGVEISLTVVAEHGAKYMADKVRLRDKIGQAISGLIPGSGPESLNALVSHLHCCRPMTAVIQELRNADAPRRSVADVELSQVDPNLLIEPIGQINNNA